jgi:flagellum-specific peptidoglycan hydrolase FlgJ
MKKILPKRNLKNVNDFIKVFSPIVLEAENNYNLPAEAMLAQIALETGWGEHILKGYITDPSEKVFTNNLFNIKATKNWTGKKAYKRVVEFRNVNDGKKKFYEVAAFRVYPDFLSSISDYCKLILNNSRYKEAVKNRKDPEQYVKEIFKAGYATDPTADIDGDPSYSEKLIKIMKNYFIVEDKPLKIPGKMIKVSEKALIVTRNLLQTCLDAINESLKKGGGEHE